MNDSNRKRRNAVVGTDLLESRRLLNAHLPQSPMVHVASVPAKAATKPITGTLTRRTMTTEPGTLGDVTITESASGSSTVGPALLRASYVLHQVTYKPNVLAKQALLNGAGTLSLGNGSVLVLKFTGTRQVVLSTPRHPATYSLKGTATVESGPNQGHLYKLTAMASASSTVQFITYRFTLK